MASIAASIGSGDFVIRRGHLWLSSAFLNLSLEDAVRFLAGKVTGGVQRICVLYLAT